MKLFMLALVLVVTVGCGMDTSTPMHSAPVVPKSLASMWRLQGSEFKADLSELVIGHESHVRFTYSTGEICDGRISLSGGEANGTLSIYGVAYWKGGGGDPGCSQLAMIGDFTKSVDELTVCNVKSLTCQAFQ